MKLSHLVLIAVLSIAVFAEDKKPETPPAAPPAAVTDAVKIKLLTAQHSLDEARQGLQSLQIRYDQAQQAIPPNVQQEIAEVQKAAPEANKKVQEAQTAFEAEVTEAYKSAGVDKEKFDFDRKAFVFTPKTSPAPPTPLPAKK